MIVENNLKKSVSVNSLIDGTVFKDAGCFYIKTSTGEAMKGTIKCVELEYGTLVDFEFSKIVYPVNAKVVIE